MEQKGSVELSLLSREAAEMSVFSSAPIRATPAPGDQTALVNEVESRNQQQKMKEKGLTVGLKPCIFAKSNRHGPMLSKPWSLWWWDSASTTNVHCPHRGHN